EIVDGRDPRVGPEGRRSPAMTGVQRFTRAPRGSSCPTEVPGIHEFGPRVPGREIVDGRDPRVEPEAGTSPAMTDSVLLGRFVMPGRSAGHPRIWSTGPGS